MSEALDAAKGSDGSPAERQHPDSVSDCETTSPTLHSCPGFVESLPRGVSVPGGGVSKQTQHRKWERFEGKAAPETLERFRYWCGQNGLSVRQVVSLLVAEFAENPRMLRLR